LCAGKPKNANGVGKTKLDLRGRVEENWGAIAAALLARGYRELGGSGSFEAFGLFDRIADNGHGSGCCAQFFRIGFVAGDLRVNELHAEELILSHFQQGFGFFQR
jgi:hypothetical protein